MQVAVNGYYVFGREAPDLTPDLFQPLSSSHDYMVAPFWANNDISQGYGNVSYEVHDETSSPHLLRWVSTFISQTSQANFTGRWMIVSEWQQIPQRGEATNTV